MSDHAALTSEERQAIRDRAGSGDPRHEHCDHDVHALDAALTACEKERDAANLLLHGLTNEADANAAWKALILRAEAAEARVTVLEAALAREKRASDVESEMLTIRYQAAEAERDEVRRNFSTQTAHMFAAMSLEVDARRAAEAERDALIAAAKVIEIKGLSPESAQLYFDQRNEQADLRMAAAVRVTELEAALTDQCEMNEQSIAALRHLHKDWPQMIHEETYDGEPVISEALRCIVDDLDTGPSRAALAAPTKEEM